MTQDAQARVAEIYRSHAASVFRRARWLLGNEADAREVLQDVFLSLLERPNQLDGFATISTFLYSMTTHACLNRLRNQKNRARLLRERGEMPSEQLPMAAEERMRVRHALERLPAQLAEVAVYYFIDELSHEEIANILGCSRRTVGNLIERIADWGRSQEVPCLSK